MYQAKMLFNGINPHILVHVSTMLRKMCVLNNYCKESLLLLQETHTLKTSMLVETGDSI